MTFEWTDGDGRSDVAVKGDDGRASGGSVYILVEFASFGWSATYDHLGENEADGSGEILCARGTKEGTAAASVAAGKRIVEAFLRAAAAEATEFSR